MLRQILAITGMNLKSLPARSGASLVVVLSLAGVIGVLVSVLAMAVGLEKTFASSGRADRVIVTRTGLDQEWRSRITREEAELLLTIPGLARDSDGTPLASVETISVGRLLRKGTGREASVGIRGVGPKVLRVRTEARLVEGRLPTPGKYELVAGAAARRMFQGLDTGAQLRLADATWTVVGAFEAGGGAHESELWGDTESVMTVLNKSSAYNTVTALLESGSALAAYQAGIKARPSLQLTAWREPDFFAAQSNLTGLIRSLGYTVAVIMALGALFSAINALYASVSSRTVEIATLRAVGFGAAPVVISVLFEGLLLCVAGGLVGGALAYPIFNGYTVASNAQSNLGQVSFAFSIDAALLLQGVLWATVIGLLGGLFPAVRAARLPVAEALRPT